MTSFRDLLNRPNYSGLSKVLVEDHATKGQQVSESSYCPDEQGYIPEKRKITTLKKVHPFLRITKSPIMREYTKLELTECIHTLPVIPYFFSSRAYLQRRYKS